MDVKDLNELQAMHRGLIKHKVQLVQFQLPVYTEMVWVLSTTEMKDRTHDQDLDKLSRYGQDVLHQLAFVAREMLAELESENYFLH